MDQSIDQSRSVISVVGHLVSGWSEHEYLLCSLRVFYYFAWQAIFKLILIIRMRSQKRSKSFDRVKIPIILPNGQIQNMKLFGLIEQILNYSLTLIDFLN